MATLIMPPAASLGGAQVGEVKRSFTQYTSCDDTTSHAVRACDVISDRDGIGVRLTP